MVHLTYWIIFSLLFCLDSCTDSSRFRAKLCLEQEHLLFSNSYYLKVLPRRKIRFYGPWQELGMNQHDSVNEKLTFLSP